MRKFIKAAFSAWTPKDVTTVGISLLSLTVAIGTFYLNNYYQRDDLILRTMSMNSTHTFQDIKKLDPSVMNFRLLLINAGNRDAIVMRAQFWSTTGQWLAETNSSSADPTLVKAGEIKVLKVPMETTLAFAAGTAPIRMEIETVTSHGDVHRVDDIMVGHTQKIEHPTHPATTLVINPLSVNLFETKKDPATK